MDIHITEEGIVFCDAIVCNPLALYDAGQECGNCPILKLAEDYQEIKFGSI